MNSCVALRRPEYLRLPCNWLSFTLRRVDAEIDRLRRVELARLGVEQRHLLVLHHLVHELLVPLAQLHDQHVEVRKLLPELCNQRPVVHALLDEFMAHGLEGLAQIVIHQVDPRLACRHRLQDLGLVLLGVLGVDGIRPVTDGRHRVVHLQQLVLHLIDALGVISGRLHHLLPGVTVVIILLAEVTHEAAELDWIHRPARITLQDELRDACPLGLRPGCRCRHLAKRKGENLRQVNGEVQKPTPLPSAGKVYVLQSLKPQRV